MFSPDPAAGAGLHPIAAEGEETFSCVKFSVFRVFPPAEKEAETEER